MLGASGVGESAHRCGLQARRPRDEAFMLLANSRRYRICQRYEAIYATLSALLLAGVLPRR